MARSDLIVSLVKAGAKGDASAFRSTVAALSAEARAKSQNILADRLDTAVGTGGGSLGFVRPAPPRLETVRSAEPRVALDDLVLPPAVATVVGRLVEEQARADVLRAHGLQPRHRVLLSGPPGNGKTSLSEAIATALGVVLHTVRYDALVGSYLGETNARLRRLLDEVSRTPCVLLFDEFEAIGKERGDPNETGEMKRVVASLLTQVDMLPSHVVVIGATNHAEMLDRAVWRRFQLRLELPQPSRDSLARFLARSLEAPPEVDLVPVLDVLPTASFAEAAAFVEDVRRRAVLDGRRTTLKDVIAGELEIRQATGSDAIQHAKRSHEATPALGRTRTREEDEGEAEGTPKARARLPRFAASKDRPPVPASPRRHGRRVGSSDAAERSHGDRP